LAEGLKVLDVRKSFGTEARPVEVLRGISFGLDAGEEVAITGPSGSGKSTLLHLIGTLDRPTSGRIEIDGREPCTLPEPQLARYRNETIGFVFQDHHLLPQCSVLENVLIPTLAFGGRASRVERARELLERVGLSDRIDHRPSELSGGERQRVAVARALVQHPRVLLCDEPTGSLDAASAEKVASLIRDLHREQGGILIVVTHNLDLAGRFANRLEIKDGRCSGT
jgi:lipoprotein-releasing system ATP-binding protein